MYKNIIEFIKSLYPNQDRIPLHAPIFYGNEKKYLSNCIDSTYVSYVGEYVEKFEAETANYIGSKHAIAIINGTAALEVALKSVGVQPGDEVLTQALTFVATPNAISHCGANPVFIDVNLKTWGLCPLKLDDWLKSNTKYNERKQITVNTTTNNKISAIVPMHTFGNPCMIEDIVKVANKYNIPIVEDSAESLGSLYNNKHTATFGKTGIISYNGNKTITTGCGGMIITDDQNIADYCRHISTTAKVNHPWEYIHDEIAYNYRMSNVSAAIGVAQMEYLDKILSDKRELSKLYKDFFNSLNIKFFTESDKCHSNYWLNAIILKDKKERDEFLLFSNNNKIMARPIWKLMNSLSMYKKCQVGDLSNSIWLQDRVVNIPSSARI